MIRSRVYIASIFRKFADKIENNTCEMDDRELNEIANMLIHRKLNAEQRKSDKRIYSDTIRKRQAK